MPNAQSTLRNIPRLAGCFAVSSVMVLLVHSAEDQFIPVERAHALAERLPQALYVEIAGTGHCSPLETPELVAKALGELGVRVESQSR